MKKVNGVAKLLVLMLLIGLGGCSAEDGAEGPQGAQGIQGEQGQQGEPGAAGETGAQGEQGEQGEPGADGADGQDGEDGNANVIYSNWLDADWNGQDEPNRKLMIIPITEISQQELRNKSLVFMYLSQWGTSSIYTMPGSGRWDNTFYNFTFGTNQPDFQGILVRLNSTDGAALDERQYAAFRGNRFRYVIIPESGQSGKLDYNDYEAVKAFYNIPD